MTVNQNRSRQKTKKDQRGVIVIRWFGGWTGRGEELYHKSLPEFARSVVLLAGVIMIYIFYSYS